MTHYLQIPINRITSYSKTVQQLKNYSDPSNPDYSSLEQITEKFVALEQGWFERYKYIKKKRITSGFIFYNKGNKIARPT